MTEPFEDDNTEEYDVEELLEYNHPLASAIKYDLDKNNPIKWPQQRPLLDREEDLTSFEEMDYFWVYDNVFP